jgi:hypothetical protein
VYFQSIAPNKSKSIFSLPTPSTLCFCPCLKTSEHVFRSFLVQIRKIHSKFFSQTKKHKGWEEKNSSKSIKKSINQSGPLAQTSLRKELSAPQVLNTTLEVQHLKMQILSRQKAHLRTIYVVQKYTIQNVR